jgi:hypothetical protein
MIGGRKQHNYWCNLKYGMSCSIGSMLHFLVTSLLMTRFAGCLLMSVGNGEGEEGCGSEVSGWKGVGG